MLQKLAMAKYLTHHSNQLQHALIVYKIINTIGFFPAAKNAFIAQDRQMLRNITLSCSYYRDNVLNANGIVAQYAKNLESQGVRHGLQAIGRMSDVFVFCNERLTYDKMRFHEWLTEMGVIE